MANANVNRIGQINQAGDVDALFLKVFAGEILASFETANVMLDKSQVRTISSGKSAQFPAIGKATASYHTPGAEIVGQNINNAEVTISIDGLLIADHFIANIDEAKNHYDYRSPITNELGIALANQMDRHLLQTGVLGARSAGVVTGRPGGSVLLTSSAGAPASADFARNGAHIAWAIFEAGRIMDENDVPDSDRYYAVRPAAYNALIRNLDNINADWGGQGSYAEGKVLKIDNFTIVKTNQLPIANVANGTTAAGTGNKYAGTFANTAGLAFHKSAIGTVKLLDLGMESAYDIRRQGTLMVAKYAVGHGVLRPEALVEVRNAAV